MEIFSFTAKINVNMNIDIAPSDYDNLFSLWVKMGCIIETKVFEDDTRGKCHVHGIISIPKGMLRKKLMLNGIHIKMEPIYDKSGWLEYIRKTVKPQKLFVREVIPTESMTERDFIEKVKSHGKLF